MNQNKGQYVEELDEIYEFCSNLHEKILIISVDKTCIISECVCAKLFDDNVMLRTKIMQSTRRMNFSSSDELMFIRHDFVKFLNNSRKKFKNVLFLTKKYGDDLNKLVEFVEKNNITFVKIVTCENISKFINNENAIMIDKNSNIFNEIKLKMSDLQLFVIHLLK
jgi:hypothetical protein